MMTLRLTLSLQMIQHKKTVEHVERNIVMAWREILTTGLMCQLKAKQEY